MGCCGHRRKVVSGGADQNCCFTPFAYGYLWLSLLISLAVYGVDTFTAVSLLALSDDWPSVIEPVVDISISKWIFSACIIASFVNLGFEHVRAWRVMKRGNVAECYLDSLAVRLESIRPGKGQGWRRFLVFASLTKSKKGAEYIALFTYFSFQSWIRVIVCSGPRQVINAITLYSALTKDLSLETVPDARIEKSIMNLLNNIRELAQSNPQTALVLAGMIFTLVIWADGGLGGYCERKVNKALVKIVRKKVNKALAKEQAARDKADFGYSVKTGEKNPLERQATLPTIPNVAASGGDKLPEMPTLQRTDTFSTLPPYVSRPASPGSFELNNMDQKRPIPNRSGTMSSSTTYSSHAPWPIAELTWAHLALFPRHPLSLPLTLTATMEPRRFGRIRPTRNEASPGQGLPRSIDVFQPQRPPVKSHTKTHKPLGLSALPAEPKRNRAPSRQDTPTGTAHPQHDDGDYYSRQQPSQGSGYGYDYDVESQRRY
ncbi:unnamed protein product [Parascedosporium putredinis]|uniref:Uncharacterized protein n=1 Tax=Parascedosporium putredinis TaxID=1442378 RepID=A0A9P1HDB4_9PEZI|nr:unnamed protein product [Parascedosporium putredinis]CAI8004679.1 unnamed protein product [Parascedosporium putredinis]